MRFWHSKRQLLGLSLGMGLWALGAQAQPDSISLKEVEVTGRAVSKDVMSAVPLQTVQTEALRQLGIYTLSSVVKRFAGVSVRDYGGIGGMKTVSVRSLGAHHTAVSYDGVVVSNTQAGQIDLSRLSLDNARLVSLSVGQATDWLQGAREQAAAAVLSIESDVPKRADPKPHWQVALRSGSFGLVNPSFRFGQQLSAHTALSATADYLHADGNYPFILKNGYLRTHEKRNNSWVDNAHGEANVYHSFADSSQLQVKGYYYRSKRGLPGGVILYNKVANETFWEENGFFQATYQRRLAHRLTLRGRLKYDVSWDKYEDVNVKYPSGRQTDVNTQREYYASATLGWQPERRLRLSLAQDFILNRLKTNLNGEPNPRRQSSLTALAATFTGARLTADARLVATCLHEHVSSGVSPEDHQRLSPSVSLTCRLLPEESLFLRLMWKNTFRVPTFNDLYYRRFGNRLLRPEKATAYNLGLTYDRQFGALHVQTTADGYFYHVKDKLVAYPSTYVWRMENFGRVRIVGLDATFSASMPACSWLSASLDVAYTYQYAVDATSPERYTYHRQLPYTPRHSGNGALILRTPWVTLGYSLTVCGARFSHESNDAEYRMAPYEEHSLTLSRDVRLRRSVLQLAASLLNFTNEQYDIIQYYPMPGRSFQMKATWKF